MKKELLFSLTKKDLEVQTFRAGGKGGQHQNKTESGVRIIHKASGAVGEGRSERSQLQNKKAALKHLVESGKFKIWLSKVISEITSGKTIEERVQEQMTPENIVIEITDENGRWVKE